MLIFTNGTAVILIVVYRGWREWGPVIVKAIDRVLSLIFGYSVVLAKTIVLFS